jgi:hypothetical protein
MSAAAPPPLEPLSPIRWDRLLAHANTTCLIFEISKGT